MSGIKPFSSDIPKSYTYLWNGQVKQIYIPQVAVDFWCSVLDIGSVLDGPGTRVVVQSENFTNKHVLVVVFNKQVFLAIERDMLDLRCPSDEGAIAVLLKQEAYNCIAAVRDFHKKDPVLLTKNSILKVRNKHRAIKRGHKHNSFVTSHIVIKQGSL